MTQRVLNFTVESSDERLTPRAGETVLGEYFKAIGLDRLCDNYFPVSKSNHSYRPFEMIQPLLLMLHAGGRVLEDVRTITLDKGLRTLLGIQRMPTADTIGKWLKRTGLQGIYATERVNRTLLRRYLKTIDEPLILDMDATVIESHKSIAMPTYKEFPGFTPMTGHVNGGYMIHSEFRPGNMAPADNNLWFLKRCENQLPKGRSFAYVRADSASYQAKLFNYCNANNITYLIGAHLDAPTLQNIKQITEWETLDRHDGEYHHIKEEVAEFLHTMNHTDHAFRIIVVRRQVTPILPMMETFLDEEELLAYANERYSVIATNAEDTAQEVVRLYRQRGETSENRIKALKGGFNLNYLPTSDFMANALYFQIGTLAYNLFILFKQTMQQSWQKHTIQTIRYKLYNIAGKVITHARKRILKVNREFVEMINHIRRRCYEISLE